jgi:CspA family cold shock protein
MRTGTVKWFNSRKGYGFIKPADGGFNVYVHISTVERAGLAELKEGQKINFDVVTDDRSGQVFAENLSVPLNRREDTHGNASEPLRVQTAARIIRQLTRQIGRRPNGNEPVRGP